ncbi:MAG: hypothetical protein RL556_665 [Actinomycetota bacterium]|jgi:predicted nucleic acid-binding Zn ribbon protein
MAEAADFSVDFYYRMRKSLAGRKSRDTKRREEQASRANSQPFEAGRSPVSVSNSIDSLLKSFSWESQISEADLFNQWAKIVGDQNSLNSTPEHINKGQLVVRCKSTAWATQLRLMQGQILQRINQEYPLLEITTLKFVGPDAPSWKKGPLSVPGRGPRDTYG